MFQLGCKGLDPVASGADQIIYLLPNVPSDQLEPLETGVGNYFDIDGNPYSGFVPQDAQNQHSSLVTSSAPAGQSPSYDIMFVELSFHKLAVSQSKYVGFVKIWVGYDNGTNKWDFKGPWIFGHSSSYPTAEKHVSENQFRSSQGTNANNYWTGLLEGTDFYSGNQPIPTGALFLVLDDENDDRDALEQETLVEGSLYYRTYDIWALYGQTLKDGISMQKGEPVCWEIYSGPYDCRISIDAALSTSDPRKLNISPYSNTSGQYQTSETNYKIIGRFHGVPLSDIVKGN